jgi:hypothetical protein
MIAAVGWRGFKGRNVELWLNEASEELLSSHTCSFGVTACKETGGLKLVANSIDGGQPIAFMKIRRKESVQDLALYLL